jgi:exosortase K
MKTKLGVLAVVALVAYGLKRHYAVASSDALSWILTPTAQLVSLVTGVAFTAVPGEGYLSAERMFLIEKACAGVNFMIAAFAMVVSAQLHRVRSVPAGVAIVGMSALVSYAAAVIVNAVRIVIAMWLAAHRAPLSSLTAAEVHRLEGVVVYFLGLLLLYVLVQRLDRRAQMFEYAVPLGSYYLVTLGLPLANGAWSVAFFRHAVIVLLVPPLVILLVCGVRRLFARYPRRNVSAGSSLQARRAGIQAAAAATTSSAPAPTM